MTYDRRLSLEEWERLTAAIKTLPFDQQVVMQLRYGEVPCTDAEIRRATGWSQEMIDKLFRLSYEALKPDFPEVFL